MVAKKNIGHTKDILDQNTINKIKSELGERKKQIEKDLAEIVGTKDGGVVKFPDYGDKTDENAQETSEYSTNLATEKVLQSTLRDIENSLKRIEKGSYGFCKYCEKEIGEKRLLARPVASACIECKTKLQRAV